MYGRVFTCFTELLGPVGWLIVTVVSMSLSLHDLNKIINAFRDPVKMFQLGKFSVVLQSFRDLHGSAWDLPFFSQIC